MVSLRRVEGLAPCSVVSMVRWQRHLAHGGRTGTPCQQCWQPGAVGRTNRKGSAEIPEIPETPCRNPARRIHPQTISSASVYPRRLVCAGWAWRKLAETPGVNHQPSGIEEGGKITSLAVVDFAHAR